MIPSAPEAGPSTTCSLSITASPPAASASTAMRTRERRSRGDVSVQFSLRTRISRGGDMTLSGVEIAHDVLDARVVLESVHREILAVARVLEAAVRHLGDERDVRVDPDTAEVEPPGDAHGATVVGRPDRGGQAVLHAVGPLHGLV